MDETTKKVMEQIEKNHVAMRPRSYFVLRGLLMAFGLVIALLTAIFIFSFVLFALKLRGVWLLPELGPGGLKDLLLSLPIFIMLFVLGFSLVALLLSKHYSFSYRNPLAFSLAALVVIVMLGGYIVAKTPLHMVLYKRFGKPGGPELVQGFYKMGRAPVHNGVMGEITNIDGSEYEVYTPRKKYCTVRITSETRLPEGTTIVIGDWIFARGQPQDGILIAYGVKRVLAEDFLLEGRQLPPEPPMSFERTCSD